MILRRFFRPKWQHHDPEVRKLALQSLSASDPALVQAAREDSNPGVRRAALYRINDLDLLRQIAAEDPEAGVRETADARLRKLMTGQEPDSPGLDARLAVLNESHPPELVDFLVLHAAEPELRLAALQRLQQESVLAEAAINDPAVDVRLAAVVRIHDEVALKRVIKHALKSDKRVGRAARARLEALQAERARAARSIEVCTAMETLAEDLDHEPNAGQFQRLEQAWEGQEAAADGAVRERYRQARERFLSRLQSSAAQRRARLEACRSLERLLERLQGEMELSSELASLIEQTLQEAGATWAQPEGPARAEERRYAELEQAVKDRERLLHRNHERAKRLHALLREADALLNQASEVLERDLTALRQRWVSLERPEAKALAADLQGRFEAVLARLRGRLQRQAEQRDQELKDIQDLIAELEEALVQGALQRAISLYDQARHRLQHNIGLSRKQMTALEERVQVCAPKLGELRGWRRWGTGRARESLCEDVERLAAAPADPQEIARQIRAARAAWKAMDSAEGAAAKNLWERFDKACERAYEPCQTYFDAKARERQANLEKRQAICERLEQLEAATDWDRADWRAIDRAWREAQQQWRTIRPMARENREAIERRFRQIVRRLNARLDAERQRDLQRRQALIHQVRQLAEGDDLRAAIEGAKRAQTEWQPTVLGSRREEQALWREFRAACDTIFERREAQQRAAETERQAHLACRIALCEALEALAAEAGEADADLRDRVQQLKQAWEAAGAVPREAQHEIERRFAAALKRIEQHQGQAREMRERAVMRRLRERASLCTRIEALVFAEVPDGADTLLEQTRREWEGLPPLPSSLGEAIQRRFDDACQALAGDAGAREALAQALQQNLERVRRLCLQLEILAGVDTPPEFAKERMEYQVSRLSESLTARAPDQPERDAETEARLIEREWHLTGTPPSDLKGRLEARFDRAMAALREREAPERRSRPTI